MDPPPVRFTGAVSRTGARTKLIGWTAVPAFGNGPTPLISPAASTGLDMHAGGNTALACSTSQQLLLTQQGSTHPFFSSFFTSKRGQRDFSGYAQTIPNPALPPVATHMREASSQYLPAPGELGIGESPCTSVVCEAGLYTPGHAAFTLVKPHASCVQGEEGGRGRVGSRGWMDFDGEECGEEEGSGVVASVAAAASGCCHRWGRGAGGWGVCYFDGECGATEAIT